MMPPQPRVLLVSENAESAAWLREALARELPEAQLTDATELAHFNRAVAAGEFELVITDHLLGWPDGLQVLQRIRERNEDHPVIVFTSAGNEEVAAAGMKAGLSDYLVKSAENLPRLARAAREALDTARKRREGRAAEIRYQRLFDNVPMGLFVFSPEGRILNANPAIVKMLGYENREALLAVKVTDFDIPREAATRCLETLRREGEIFDLEVQLGRPDGSVLWLLTSARAARDESGAVLYYQGAVENITERKRTEDALRDSEQRFEAFMENAPVVAFIKDADGRHAYVNRLFEQTFGKDRRDVVGRKDADLFPADVARHLIEHDQLVLVSGKKLETSESVPAKNGEMRSWMVIKFPIPGAQDRNFIGGVAIDVTERQRAEDAGRRNEQRFRDLFESSPEAIFVEDLNGYVLDANPAACQLHGIEPGELIGKNILDLVPAERRGEVARDFPKLARGELVRVEGFSINAQKEAVPVELSASRMEYRGKQALLLHVRDMRDHKRLQEQFLQSQKMEAVGRLAGGIAHDFNNLLTAIIGYNELLLAQLEESNPLRAHAEQVRRASERAAKLTRQLLAFSRKQTLQPRVIDLNVTVSDLEKMLHRLLGDEVQLVTQAAPGGASVRADPGQIEQVLINLAVNARDAMPNGGRLLVSVENVRVGASNASDHPDIAEGDYALLTVSDNGSGMPPEVQVRLFEPFYTTKEAGKGTGLGLATCYGIIEQSGGRIAFESEPQQGTAFFIYLPRVGDHPELPTQREPSPALPRGTETIVVAEDAPSVRQLSVRVLRDLGYDVHPAADGAKALDVIRRLGKIDLLLTDVMMPVMNGKRLVELFREKHPDTEVLFNSGSLEDDIELRDALQHPHNSFLAKPFAPTELARKVREVLDGNT